MQNEEGSSWSNIEVYLFNKGINIDFKHWNKSRVFIYMRNPDYSLNLKLRLTLYKGIIDVMIQKRLLKLN